MNPIFLTIISGLSSWTLNLPQNHVSFICIIGSSLKYDSVFQLKVQPYAITPPRLTFILFIGERVTLF